MVGSISTGRRDFGSTKTCVISPYAAADWLSIFKLKSNVFECRSVVRVDVFAGNKATAYRTEVLPSLERLAQLAYIGKVCNAVLDNS